MKPRNPLSFVIAWLALALGPAYLGVAANAGPVSTTQEMVQVTGRVKNVATGDYLRSASIQVEGTNLSTLTDFAGAYALSVPPGSQTLLVSYTGLDTARVSVQSTPGITVTRDVELTSGIYALEPFTVTGEREGNALAIQLQRLAPNLKTVASIDAYGNPSANPAELLQRLSGIAAETITGDQIRSISVRGMTSEFSVMLIDGETVANSQGSSANRVYQPEQFGTGNLSSVELIKAPTPDQDANAIAGYVNLVTKRGFEQAGRNITVNLGLGWRDRGFKGSPFQDKFADDLGLVAVSYSDVFSVFSGKNNLGVAVNVSRSVYTTLQEEAGSVYAGLSSYYLAPDSSAPLTRFVGYGDFWAPTKAINTGASIDYKLSPNSYVFAKFSYNTNDQLQQLFRIGIGNAAATAANFTPGSTYESSTLLPSATSTANPRIVQAPRDARNYGVNLGSEHTLFGGSATLSLRSNYSHADLLLFNTHDIQALATGIGLAVDRRGRDAWYPSVTQTAGPSIYDPASYRMTTWTRTDQSAPNDLYGARADFTKNFATAAPASIKVGVKYNDSQRQQRTKQSQYTFVGADRVANSADDSMVPYAKQSLKLSEVLYGPFPFTNFGGSGGADDPTTAASGYWGQTAANAYNSYSVSNGANNDFAEKIAAGYISGRVDLGKLRILSGLRVENTKVTATGWTRNTTAAFGGNSVGGASLDPAVVAADVARAQRSFVTPRKGKGEYKNVFPGVHFVYEPMKSFLIRASYNRSITRPGVGNLLPTLTENLTAGSVSVGNPDLKPYFSNNFDLSVEKYFEPIGLFSAGVFLKEISNYFRSFSSILGPEGLDGSGMYAGYTLTRTMNIGSARVRGVELGYQQQFSKLPGFWRGFGAFANLTILQAVGNFGTLVTSTKLPGMVPRTANAGISYSNYGLQLRLLGNFRATSPGASIGLASGGIEFKRMERLSLDLKINYRINRMYNVYLDVANLNNAASREDVSAVNGLPWIRTKPGVVFNAGVTARF
jgi:TonB-dependent receptor